MQRSRRPAEPRPAAMTKGVGVVMIGFVDGKFYVAQLVMEPSQFVPGATIPFHGMETFAAVVQAATLNPTTKDDFIMLGFVGGGEVVLDQASTTPGEPVSGRYSGLFAPVM